MNNKGKKGKTGKKSPRPSHSGRPVSVKKTSSGSSRRKKKSLRKKNPIKILQRIVLICIIVIVAFAACALGYAFFEMRMEQSETQSGYPGMLAEMADRNNGRQKEHLLLMWSF